MSDTTATRKFSVLSLVGFVIVLGAVFTFIYSKAAYFYDFVGHMIFVREIQAEGLGSVPHFLYHGLILGFAEIFTDVDWFTIAGHIVIGANLIVGVTIYLLLTARFKAYISQVVIGFLSLCLVVITPIILWTEYWPAMIGYIHPTVYHNPTQNILKVFVIPVSLIALRAINPQPYKSQAQRIGLIVLSIVLILLMSISKPNYTIILLPSLGLYVLYRLAKRQAIDWALLIVGIGAPSLAVLALQFLGTYASEESVIAFEFIKVVRLYIAFPRILLQFLLSIAFPLVVYLLHRESARQDTYLNLAWIGFLIGAFYMYFVYETGIREQHGNFFWSAYVGLFVLMFATMIFLLKEYRPYLEALRQDKNTQVPPHLKWILLVFVLHMASAVRYYMMFITQLPR